MLHWNAFDPRWGTATFLIVAFHVFLLSVYHNHDIRPAANETILYLADLKPSEEPHTLDQAIPCKRQLAGEDLKLSIDAHPKEFRPGDYRSFIKFDIPEGYHHLLGAAGIADVYEGGKRIGQSNSPLVFKIFGGDRQLWESRRLQRSPSLQFFDVDVSGMKTLTLSVDCVGQHIYAWAVWVRPTLCM